jgi:hypothetical protein
MARVRLRHYVSGVAAIGVAIGVLLGFAVDASAIGACTDQFTGAVSDAWENPSNWSAGIPTQSTVACWSGLTVVVSSGSQIAESVDASNGGGLTVTGGVLNVPGGQSPVGNLTLSGGSLSGPFLDTGDFSWSGGTLEANVDQSGGGSATISGSAVATLVGGLATTSPITITNPNVVASLPAYAEPVLSTTSSMTFGPGVTIGSGNADPVYAATEIATNAGPTYGFAGPYQLHLSGGGTTTVAAGTTLGSGSGGSLSLESGSLTGGGETLDVQGTLDGAVSVPSETNGQLIEGTGVINGDVSVEGSARVEPGDPLGTLTVNGSYFQDNGGVGFAIAGTAPGSGYSQLIATGPVTFVHAAASGEFLGSSVGLGVIPENGFTPSINDTFDVVHSPGGVAGDLSNASGTYDIAGGDKGEYGIAPSADDITLDIVPANTSWPVITGASGGDGTPWISGAAYPGDTLTCSPGTWDYAPTSYTYKWTNQQGSTPTEVVQASEIGSTVYCTVYATNANGSSGPEYSQEISIEARPVPTHAAPPVSDRMPVVTTPVVTTPVVTTPAASTPPTPPGTAIVSAKLRSATAGITLRVRATGPATGFECALVRLPRGKHKLRYQPCRVSVTFKHLRAGRYEVYIRAVGTGGVDGPPATYRFRAI